MKLKKIKIKKKNPNHQKIKNKVNAMNNNCSSVHYYLFTYDLVS